MVEMRFPVTTYNFGWTDSNIDNLKKADLPMNPPIQL